MDGDPREDADRLRRQLAGKDIRIQFEPDRDHLLRMSDNIRLMPSEIGEHRHLKLLRHCTRMAAHAPPPTIEDFEENDEAGVPIVEQADVEIILAEDGLLGSALQYRAAAEAIVRWINTQYDNEHTNQDYRTALRSFGRYRLKLDDPPASLSWIPTGTSNAFNPVPSERDLLLWEQDVVPMIEACLNPRDKALIAVQFEAGLRSGELFDLRVSDIFDSEFTTGLHVDGKRGERAVHLLVSVPYLQQWLDAHPGGDSDYLWTKLREPERPTYTTWRKYLNQAARRADVSKNVTPTNFRKSNTRWLVIMGYSQPRIEDRQGRQRGSEHTARYMARFGEESNERRYAELLGVDVGESESPDVGPIICPRCERESPRHREQCVWCHFALSPESLDKIAEQDDRFVESAAQAKRPEEETDEQAVTTEDVIQVRKLIKENPELRRVLLEDQQQFG